MYEYPLYLNIPYNVYTLYIILYVNFGVQFYWLAKNGSVIITEKKSPSALVDDSTIEKVSMVCENIGLVYSGMGPDARILLASSRKYAQSYRRMYGEYPSTLMLVRHVASVMQEYTQSGGVRPFGVSLLVTGVDSTGSSLYQVDPSGAFWAWKASAIGKNMINCKSFLEKRYSDDLDLEDALHIAILALKEGFEGLISPTNIEIGVTHEGRFHILTSEQISEYLTNI